MAGERVLLRAHHGGKAAWDESVFSFEKSCRCAMVAVLLAANMPDRERLKTLL
jgi:hypothetical protein